MAGGHHRYIGGAAWPDLPVVDNLDVYAGNRRHICRFGDLVCPELQDDSECQAGCEGVLEAASRACLNSSRNCG